jgi:hypothetical protein
VPFTKGEIKILMSQNHTMAAREKRAAVKNLLRSLGPCSLSKPRQQGDNYQSLEDHFLKLPPLAYYTLRSLARTYIFYSNFAVPFKLYLIKASHFCQLPQALLTMEDGTIPAYTPILPKVPQTFINLVCTALQITNIECLKIKA